MKLFNIVSTAAIFSSTFTWAKNLEKLLEEAGDISYKGKDLLDEKLMIADLQKKSETVDVITEDLKRQATKRDNKLSLLEKILSETRKAIDENVGDISTNA